MKIKQFIFYLWLLLAVNYNMFSQDYPYYLSASPSPNTASFTRGVIFPANLSTGKHNIEIPLYTINSDNLNVPITINYNDTDGIQLDELASWVGLGWNLNAGGVIAINSKGDQSISSTSNTGILDFNLANYNLLYDIYKKGGTNLPDEYIINAPGLSGIFKFIDGKAVFNDLQNTKATMSYFDNVNKTKSYFEITQNNGTIYRFGLGLDNTEATEAMFVQNNGVSTEKITAWYLTEIISDNGTNIISYKYKTLNNASLYPVIMGEKLQYGSLTFPYFNPLADPIPPVLNGPFSMSSILPNTVLATSRKQFLTSINFKNGLIEFSSSFGRQDLMDDYKLDNIKIYSTQAGINTLIHNYSFVFDYYNRNGGGIISPFYGYQSNLIENYNSTKNIMSRDKSLKLTFLLDNILSQSLNTTQQIDC